MRIILIHLLNFLIIFSLLAQSLTPALALADKTPPKHRQSRSIERVAEKRAIEAEENAAIEREVKQSASSSLATPNDIWYYPFFYLGDDGRDTVQSGDAAGRPFEITLTGVGNLIGGDENNEMLFHGHVDGPNEDRWDLDDDEHCLIYDFGFTLNLSPGGTNVEGLLSRVEVDSAGFANVSGYFKFYDDEETQLGTLNWDEGEGGQVKTAQVGWSKLRYVWVCMNTGLSSDTPWDGWMGAKYIKVKPASIEGLLPEDQSYSPNECPLCSNAETRHYVGGPIDTYSGNYNYQTSDIAIPTPSASLRTSLGYPLKFERSYNSHTITPTAAATGVYSRPLGYGWTHNYDVSLIFPGDLGGEANTLILKAPHGSRLRFEDKGDGIYSPYPGVHANLSQIGDTYLITAANQSVYTFGTSAGNPVRPRLLALRDPKENETSFTYTADRLSRVTGPSASRWLDFSYDAEGRLDALSDHSGRSLSYSYDAQDRLTAVTDTRGLVWTYEYTSTTLSAGSGTTSLLHAVIDPEGRAVERTYYNEESRAIAQENGAGEAIVRIAYPDPFTRVVAEFGRIVTDIYDGRGLLIGQVDAEGNRQAYGLDGNFNRNSTQDGNGNRTSFVRNEFGYTTALTDALGNTSIFTYSSTNNLSALQDARGYVTHYTYDGNNNLTGVLNPLGDTAAFTYNGRGQVTTAQNENGHLTRFAYDEFGNTVAITDALGNVTAFGYDTLGRLITSTDALGRITLNDYDAGDNLIRVIENYAPSQAQNYQNSYNLITRYAYDGANRPLLITDTLKRATKYEYDLVGRLSQTSENHLPGQPQSHQTRAERSRSNEYNLVTQYAYDTAGRLILVTDTSGRQTRTIYDNRNLVEQTIVNYQDGLYDPASPDEDLITRYEYDAAGNLVNVIDSLGRVTHSDYDPLNRNDQLIQNYQPGSSAPDANLTTRYAYDSTGNLSQIVNPKLVLSGAEVSQIANYQYDLLNRLSTVIENYVTGVHSGIPDQDVTTRYGYDPVGNRTAVTDANGYATTFTFDSLNRPTAMQDPLGNQTAYGYDALSNQTVITDANGLSTHFDYNAANRLTIIDYADATPDVALAYDPAGNVLTITDGLTNHTAYQYDSLNRLTQISDSFNQTLTYRYDSLNRRAHLIQPGNRSLTYTYDLADRLTTLSDWDGGQYRYAYDGAHQLTALEYPNGIETAYAYDGAGRLITLTHQSGGQTLARYAYTLDPLGNRLQAVENVLKPVAPIASPHFVYLPLIFKGGGGSGGPSLPPTRIIDYAYDNLNRLTNANYSTHSTGSGQAGETFAYGYDPVGNRTQMTNDQGQVTNYQYDAANRLTNVNGTAYNWDNNGNLLNDGNRAFTYDAANRLTQVVSGSLASQFEYNGLGDRTRKWTNGVETQYRLDPVGLTQVLAESTGGQTIHYLPGLAQYSNNSWAYQLPDPLGSVRQLVDANRQVTLAQSYTPFGNVLEQVGAGQNGFGYTGEQQDPLTQLVYLRARYYDPVTGRFISKDPFPGLSTLPQTQNPYPYVVNNPINLTDPSGEIAPLVIIALGLTLAGVALLSSASAPLPPGEAPSPEQGLLGYGLLFAGAGLALWPGLASFGGSICSRKAFEMANSPASQRAVQWLEQDPNKVRHIMQTKHAWGRLVNLSGNSVQDYRAIQPYLQQVISTQGEQIGKTKLGPLMEFSKTINGQQVVVEAIQLADDALRISNAWVKTQ